MAGGSTAGRASLTTAACCATVWRPDYARRRIADELKTKPYRCRFIDTTTASPWRECYSPDHPLTRTESKRWKMELLDVVSREFKLVTGCETGHEASVPYLHYFEGMLSLGPYRVKDAGRRMAEVVDDVPEQIAKFQTGHYYRLPLWELVYHDCTVAQWYWGDYNNKLPKVWDRRDLWNALYGTPPMFLFVRKRLGAEPRPVRQELSDGHAGGAGRPATARCFRTPGSTPTTPCSKPASPTASW